MPSSFWPGALFVFFNHFLVWRPGKISATLPGTLVISGYQALFGILGAVLFVGLARRRKRIFRAYWTSLAITMVWLLFALSPSAKDIPIIFGCGAILSLIGIFIQGKREWFGFRSTT